MHSINKSTTFKKLLHKSILIKSNYIRCSNSRLRYYLTARLEKKFNFLSQDIIDNEDLLNKCYIKTEKPIEIYKFINFNEKDEESQLKKELYLIDKVLTKESSMSMGKLH